MRRHLCYLSLDHGIDVAGTKGASVHVRAICSALASLGHRVTVVVSRCGEDPQSVGEALGCSVTVLPQARDLTKLRRSLRGVYGDQLRFPPEVRQWVINREALTVLPDMWRGDRPDAIIERLSLMGVAGTRVSKELGVPHLLEVNALLSEEARRHRALWDLETARAAEDEALSESDGIFAVSEPLREAIIARGVRPQRVHVLPNGFDESLFVPRSGDDMRKRLGVADCFTVGFSGSMRPWHGVRTLLGAFEQLASATDEAALVLIGAGEESDRIGDFQQRHPDLRVVTTGAVKNGDVPDLLAACDALVAPYEADGEFHFSPIKIFEYMAMGKPIAASRQGQIRDLIRDGETGLLFEPGDAEGLQTALRRLQADAPLRDRLGTAACDAVQGRTWRANAVRVLDLLEELGT